MNFSRFGDYSRFLLKGHLEELTRDTVREARKAEVPLLKLFQEYSEEKFHRILYQGLKDFLSAVSENKGLEYIRERNRRFKEDKITGVSSKEVSLPDVVIINSLRRRGLIRWLRRYTGDMDEYERIILEIEDFYMQADEDTFGSFVSVQQDLLVKEKELNESVLDASFNSVVALEAIRNKDQDIVDFRYVLLNDTAEKALSRDKQVVLTNTLLTVFPSVKKGGIFDIYKRTVETGQGFDHEFYYPYEGFNHWMRQAGVKWRDGLVVTTIDITPLKQYQQELQVANEQLRESEEKLVAANQRLEEKIMERTEELVRMNRDLQLTKERFVLVSKATNDAVWDWDLKTNKLWWNKGFRLMFGYNEDEIEPGIEFWHSRIHPDDRDRIVKDINAVIESGMKNWKGAYRFRHKDGTYRFVYDRGFTVTDEKGIPVRMAGSMQDITERQLVEEKLKKMTETLQQNENQLRIITNSLPAFISYVDPDYTYRYVNDYYSKLPGVDGKAVGKHVVDILGDKGFEKARPFLEKAFAGEAVSYDNKLILKNGTEVEVATRYVPDKDYKGHVNGIVVLGIDLTERLQFERMLARQNEELVKINLDLDNFVYTASHDLRAPVSNIEGLINTLRDEIIEELPEDHLVQSILNMMRVSVEKFKGTIQDLTEISKVQRLIGDELEEISLPDLVEDVKISIQDLIKSEDAKIYTDFSQAGTIKFSRKNLKSIIYNLINNAIKYRKPEARPEVSVSASVENGFYLITVRDNGLGISDQQKEKIFSMFKRFHTHVEGTGVGLYIVKRIVDNAGGRIEVESESGLGSTFRVFLPVL